MHSVFVQSPITYSLGEFPSYFHWFWLSPVLESNVAISHLPSVSWCFLFTFLHQALYYYWTIRHHLIPLITLIICYESSNIFWLASSRTVTIHWPQWHVEFVAMAFLWLSNVLQTHESLPFGLQNCILIIIYFRWNVWNRKRTDLIRL